MLAFVRSGHPTATTQSPPVRWKTPSASCPVIACHYVSGAGNWYGWVTDLDAYLRAGLDGFKLPNVKDLHTQLLAGRGEGCGPALAHLATRLFTRPCATERLLLQAGDEPGHCG